MKESDTKIGPWWEDLYDDVLAEVLLTRTDDREIARTIQFLTEKLQLESGDLAFDQCCGIGSLALPMGAAGIGVIGVDQAEAYVRTGQTRALEAKLPVKLHTGDAGSFVPEKACDAAFNWWTSFGYSPSDEHNAEMLHRAFESLRPGGRFAIDTMNLPGVFRGFQRDVILRKKTPGGEVVLLRESKMDLPRGMLNKVWTFVLPDGRLIVRESSVRLYLPHTLSELLKAAGFVDVTLYGSVRGELLTLDSPRCIAVAQRPMS